MGLSTTTTSTNTNTISSSKIFDIIGHFAQPNPSLALPRTPIVCKPSVDAIERALKIANINPQRTVRLSSSFRILAYHLLIFCVKILLTYLLSSIFLLFQLFFEDSVRNIQAGKCLGLHTVLVSHWKFCTINMLHEKVKVLGHNKISQH